MRRKRNPFSVRGNRCPVPFFPLCKTAPGEVSQACRWGCILELTLPQHCLWARKCNCWLTPDHGGSIPCPALTLCSPCFKWTVRACTQRHAQGKDRPPGYLRGGKRFPKNSIRNSPMLPIHRHSPGTNKCWKTRAEEVESLQEFGKVWKVGFFVSEIRLMFGRNFYRSQARAPWNKSGRFSFLFNLEIIIAKAASPCFCW